MDANYYLLPGSPAIGAASDGENIGAYGVSGNAPIATSTPTTPPTSQPSNTPASTASPTPTLPIVTPTAIQLTSTSTTLPTTTSVPPTVSPTPTLPTVTPTAIQSTSTSTTLPTTTSVPPTVSTVPTLPTVTPTAIQPTSTSTTLPTMTSVPPTTTPTTLPTMTSVPPTTTPTALPANTSVPPTATPKSTDTSQPVSPITYDDKNSAFSYSSGWQTVTATEAYGGSYKETTENGASVVLPFTGQSFSIIYRGGAYGQFDVFIDAQLVATLDEKLATDTYQQRWDYPGQFAQGSHRLKLVFKFTNTNVNCGSLDAVIIR